MTTLYLAPMEGLTTFVYRNAFQHHYGQIDKYYSPFLSNKNLSQKDKNDVCPEHNAAIHLVPQILTNNAETFLAIADKLADYGYHEVNLNLGCPSKTVVTKHRGAGFLSSPLELDHFLAEIFQKCPLEISIKTRIGMEGLDEWPMLLRIFSYYPIKEFIVHPRLQNEYYNGTPHTEAFVMAERLLDCRLCYNGDLNTPEDVAARKNDGITTDTLMLGRGVLRNPLLPCEIKTGTTKKDMRTFRAFHEEILEGYLALMTGGDLPVLHRMKELWTYMGSYVDLTDKQMKQIQKCTSISKYCSMIDSFLSHDLI